MPVVRDVVPIRRALLSVDDKTGIVELAAALADEGVELVSTGRTAAAIAEAGHPVVEVSSVTGFPESLDGRVKTLHPAVHAGLLADVRRDDHAAQLADLGIRAFELVVSNLYPFVRTVESGARGDDVVEQIDIGGPAMVRSAAKNHANVAIVTSPDQYPELIAAVRSGGTSLRQRRELAAAAFAHTAAYDAAVAAWFAREVAADAVADADPDATAEASAEAEAGSASPFPARLTVQADLAATLRYGENSHQAAALYTVPGGHGLAQAEQLHGKEMSFNNYVDADAAVRAVFDFDGPAVAIIKHANPCGIAVGSALAEAHARAQACDPVSAFGGVVAANRTIDRATAESIAPIFTEVVVAPDFDDDAREILAARKNLRMLRLPDGFARAARELTQLSGGLLQQDVDAHFADPSTWTLAAGDPVDAATLADLAFAWTACRSVKSNAILLAHDGASVGIGMGQVNRVDSCRLAVERAGDRAAGSVAASDAYFPFADGPAILIEAGVRAIVQPGGSVRDGETVEAAAAAGVALYLTGERHFFH